MNDVNVNSTPEAAYVRTLKWDYDGFRYTCRSIPETVKDKLVEIFEKWKIGYDGDKVDCKGGSINLNVYEKQFKRVKFSFDTKTTVATETK